MKRVKVSAPGKLMLFGEHGAVYGRQCLVMAVNKRIEVEVERLEQERLVIEAPKELNDVRFVKAAIRNFRGKYNMKGVRVITKNGFSSSYGFGSSAAVTVAVVKALHELRGVEISKKELFDFCYQVVVEVQGAGSGFDVAAAIFGGVLYFKDKGKVIKKLKVKDLPIIVGYSGIKAETSKMIKQVAKLKQERPEMVEGIFKEIVGIVERAKSLLTERKWQKLGELMDDNQKLLVSLKVSSKDLEQLIEGAKKAGSWGAKLSGAGGGDCMMALVRKDKRLGVEKEMEKVGGKVLGVKLENKGVRVEK